MDQLDRAVQEEIFKNIELEEELITKIIKCQTYKQLQMQKIDINSEVAKDIFKYAVITHTSTIEAVGTLKRLNPVKSYTNFI